MLWVDDVRNYVEPNRHAFSKPILYSIDQKPSMTSIIMTVFRNG